jgi:hypothetical protein
MLKPNSNVDHFVLEIHQQVDTAQSSASETAVSPHVKLRSVPAYGNVDEEVLFAQQPLSSNNGELQLLPFWPQLSRHASHLTLDAGPQRQGLTSSRQNWLTLAT